MNISNIGTKFWGTMWYNWTYMNLEVITHFTFIRILQKSLPDWFPFVLGITN